MSRWEHRREKINTSGQGERLPFVEQAIQGQAREKRRNAGPQNRSQMPRIFHLPLFFDLHIREIRKGKPERQWPDVQELMPGHRYALFLSGDSDGTTLDDNLRPQGVTIDETIQLRLSWPAEMQKKGGKQMRELTLSYQEAKACECFFPFTLPRNFPSGSIVFSLEYLQNGKRFYQQLGCRKMSVRGSYNPEETYVLKKCQIQVGLPPNVALLMVDFAREPAEQDQVYKLSLYGWTCRGELLQEIATLDTLVSVEQLFRQSTIGKDPEAIVSKMLEFSRRFSGGLIHWLLALQKNCGQHEQFCLIIVDHTTLRRGYQLEIPWEMLDLRPGDYCLLGADVQVVRWLPFRYYTWLAVERVQHRGALLSYLDPDFDMEKIQAERAILEQLCTQPYPTLDALETRLRTSLQDIGLLYIGCHGLNGNELYPSKSLQRPSDRLNAIKLELLHPGSHFDKKPLFTVFLNTCESARIIGSYRTDKSSFVAGFLGNGARGFIGTLASVRVRNASEIAEVLLKMLTNGEQLLIAEALRRLRAQALPLFKRARELPQNAAREELYYKALDTFLYVYYGDPLASLDLHTDVLEASTVVNALPQAVLPGEHEGRA